MTFSRDNPSHRYRELLELYGSLHAHGESQRGLTADRTYPGISLLPHLQRIKSMIEATGARTLLDYGCGKAQLYDATDLELPGVGRIETVIDYWDVEEVRCYDPCVPRFATLPSEPADGVITTDVLEHCPEPDLDWIVAELFDYARSFVFASIACYPAKTHLPNGENAHCTIRPVAWWNELFTRTARRYPSTEWKLALIEAGAH